MPFFHVFLEIPCISHYLRELWREYELSVSASRIYRVHTAFPTLNFLLPLSVMNSLAENTIKIQNIRASHESVSLLREYSTIARIISMLSSSGTKKLPHTKNHLAGYDSPFYRFKTGLSTALLHELNQFRS